MLTGVTVVSESLGFGPPFVTVRLNSALYPVGVDAGPAVKVGFSAFASDNVNVGAPALGTCVHVYVSGCEVGLGRRRNRPSVMTLPATLPVWFGPALATTWSGTTVTVVTEATDVLIFVPEP